jgi:chorismate dehydratase
VSQVAKKLVIAAIDFVNPAPLMWDFEHEPLRSELAERYEIHSSTPAECAARLQSGEAHIGLVPVAAYPSLPNSVIVPRCTIASLDHIRSIVLVKPRQRSMQEIQRVTLDTSSLTSATYTRILFQKLWHANPEFVAHAPDLDAMLHVSDAALLIGDPALLALEDREARETRTGQQLDYIDLAHEWHKWTGTRWVSAFWAVREDALSESTVSRAQLVEDFERSRDNGLAHTEDLVREWSSRVLVSAAVLRAYLTENIYYFLDDACLEGLDLFYRYAAECGALPHVPELKFL